MKGNAAPRWAPPRVMGNLLRTARSLLFAALTIALAPGHAAALVGPAPLAVHPSGRFLVDVRGNPFRIHGDVAWDLPTKMTLAQVRHYLDDRKARGFNLVQIQLTQPVDYVARNWRYYPPFVWEKAPEPAQGTGRPFLKTVSGNTWAGEWGTADWSTPNDVYFAWIERIVLEAAARGIVIQMVPAYMGFDHSDGSGSGAWSDGWWPTINNSANTRAVMSGFGTYLANGHGVFGGLKSHPNIIWEMGVDMIPDSASWQAEEGTARLKAMMTAIQATGDKHLWTGHWRGEYLSTYSRAFGPFMQIQSIYTNGNPTSGPTYGATRYGYQFKPTSATQGNYGSAAAPPAVPTVLTETSYEGSYVGAPTAAQVRQEMWGGVLSGIAGAIFGNDAIWLADFSPSWQPSHAYSQGETVQHGTSVYSCRTPGTSASSGGPTGVGATDIVDGSAHWAWVTYTWPSQLNSAGAQDMQRMGVLLDSIPWSDLVPNGLGGIGTLITAGGGANTKWSEGASGEAGGTDYVVAAATPSGSHLLAYIPDPHTGTVTVDVTKLSGAMRARWYDPTSALYRAIGNFSKNGVAVFVPPGANAAGANDWVLVLDRAQHAGVLTLSPSTPATSPRGNVAFAASGGSGSRYAWSLIDNRSGATIDAGSGVYMAGVTGGVTDVVQVVDSEGNVSQARVTVQDGATVASGKRAGCGGCASPAASVGGLNILAALALLAGNARRVCARGTQ